MLNHQQHAICSASPPLVFVILNGNYSIGSTQTAYPIFTLVEKFVPVQRRKAKKLVQQSIAEAIYETEFLFKISFCCWDHYEKLSRKSFSYISPNSHSHEHIFFTSRLAHIFAELSNHATPYGIQHVSVYSTCCRTPPPFIRE